MRRRSLLLAAVPAGLVTLAGCGDKSSSSSKASASPSASASASVPPPKIVDGPLPAITAGTKFDEKPTVAKGSGDPSKNLAVKTVIAGSGKTVAENDFIQANYLGQIWSTGKVFDQSYDRTPLLMQLAAGSIIDGWRYGLAGKKAGSRVLMAVPPTWGYGSSGNAQAGIKGTDTLVFVVDVLNSYNSKSSSTGKEVAQSDAALPKVGTNTDGKAPSVDIPKADPPKKLVSNYVLEGDGPEVKAAQTILCQFKGEVWDSGKVFEQTYESGRLAQFSVTQMQQVVKGLAQGITGKKVGSRIMVVTPPDLAYGDNPPSGGVVQKGSTLVFSVDILAAM